MTAATVPTIAEADEQLLSLRQLRQRSGTSDWFLRQLVRDGKLAVVRLSSRCIRVRASEWARYLHDHSQSGPRAVVPRSAPVRSRSRSKRRTH